jgi:hypothetical protein
MAILITILYVCFCGEVVMDESSELKDNRFDSTSGETCIVFFLII